jgi:hypothetical protein
VYTVAVVYTVAAKSFDDVEIVCLGLNGLGDNFSLGTSKNDFTSLIYLQITIFVRHCQNLKIFSYVNGF